MYTPTAEDVALAFELGGAEGGLVHVRRGDTDAWRLETATGSYFVKGYFSTTGGQFQGEDLTDQLAFAMAFEREALMAGVDMPVPVMPVEPLLGWVTRIEDRMVRVYRWVEHSPTEPDVSTWLGQTMLQVHQLRPIGGESLPRWWRQAVQSQATWEGWFAKARDRDASWAGLFQPSILAVTERIAELCDVVPDLVTTHGDFKPHNLVRSVSGPVLVDWDSVRTDSAALEAGRVAYIFGSGDPEQINSILTTYVDAGGELGWAGPDLFLSVTRHHIQVLAEHIRASLGEEPAAHWMGDAATIEATIAAKLRELPSTIDHLRYLASTVGSP
jgi:fructosamine-3-kinase